MPIVLPAGFQITNNEPVDSRMTVADQAARLNFSAVNVFNGLIVFQRDTNELYVLTDTGSYNLNSGWKLIGSGSGSIPSGTVSSSAQIIAGLPSGTISGSSQLPSGIVSSSVQTISNLGGTGILSGSTSVPSGTVSSSAQIVANLPSGTVSGSVQVLGGSGVLSGSISSQLPSGVVSSSVQTIANLPSGTVSGSVQVLGGSGVLSGSISSQLPSGVVSSSVQTISNLGGTGILSGSTSVPSGTVSSSAQTIANLDGTGILSGSTSVPSGTVSSSAQIVAGLPSGTVSGSVQVLGGTGILSGSISSQLPSGVVSSSAQTIANLPSGTVSGSVQVLGGSGVLSGSISSQLPSGVVSGSAQTISNLSGTGILSGSTSVPSGTVSSSAQIVAGLPSGTVSGSVQVLGGTGILSGSISSQLPSGVVSGSAQTIANLDGTGILSGSTSVPSGTVSSSAQIAGLGYINQTETSSMSVASSSVAGVAVIATYTSEWTLGANGSSDYTFTGPGLTGAENDPTIYLTRGQQYKFTNNMNQHPFRIQSTPNGSTGTPYNDGITNNNVSNGTLLWNVQFDSPDTLYYQCTAHAAMGGKIVIIDSGSSASIPSGTVSSSAQIVAGLPSGVISGSSQLPSGIVSSSVQTIANLDGTGILSGSTSVPSGTVSSSAQIVAGLPSGVVSGSAQTIANLDGTGILSGSVSVPSGTVSSSAQTIANLDGTGILSGSVTSASYSVTSSFMVFDGNRAISNQYQPTGIYGENYGTNNVVDFLEQAYFANTPPVIDSLVFDVNEYSAQGTTVGTIAYTDPEGVVTFQTQSSYTADDFRVASNGVISVQTTLLTESLENDTSQGYDAVLFPVRGTDINGATVDKNLYIRIAGNTAPVFREDGIGGNVLTTNFTASLSESSAAGAKSNGTVYFTDVNSDTITIGTGSLSTAFNNAFTLTVNATNVALTQTTSSLDYDTNPKYEFVLTASDEHYESGQDPTSITYLPYQIRVLDNATPTINDQQFDINENVNVSNGQGLLSGEYRNVGQLSADGNDVGDVITYSNFTLQSLSIDGVNVPIGTYSGTGQSDPTEDAFEVTSAGYITRKNGVFVNSDLINKYVYQVTVRDQYDPGTDTALIDIDIDDDTAPSINKNWGARAYIIESAETNDFAYTNTNGYSGTVARNTSTYNVQNETVSWTINSPSNVLNFNGTQQIFAASDISGSYTDGDTIAFSVTASNTFGTENRQSYTIEVSENLAPSVAFSLTAGGFTGSQSPGTTIGTINVSDSQGENISNLTLSGADAGSFVLGTAPAPGSSRTWNLNVGASSLQTGSYSLNGVGTDAYGKSTTQPISITIAAPAASDTGYVYTMDLNADFDFAFGISGRSSATPPVPTVATTYGFLDSIVNSDTLGDASINFSYGGTYQSIKRLDSTGTTPDNLISGSNLGAGSGGFQRVIVFVPNGGNMDELPTSFTINDPTSGNTTTGQYVNFVSVENSFQNSTGGLDNDIKATQVLNLTLGTAVNGYTNWYMIATTDRFNSTDGNIYMRMIPANAASGSTPT